MTRKFIAALGVSAALVGVTTIGARATAIPPPTTPPQNVAALNPQVVLTDVNGLVTAQSASLQRLIVVGQDLDQRPLVAANTTYAVINTTTHTMLSRRNTNGTIDNTAIDEQRGVAYLTVATLPTRISGAGAAYHIDLWTVSLRTGKLLSDRLFYEGEAETINAIAVDSPTGHIFVASTRPGSGTYELTMINTSDMSLHIQSLQGPPQNVFVDSAQHRVVVTLSVGIAATTSQFDGYDSRTEKHDWSHLFQYILSSYSNFAQVYNPRTQQIWSVAPGGLVTVVDAATGHIARQIQMGYTRPDAWSQVGFALDTDRNVGYAQWAGAPDCFVDQANERAAIRSTMIDYSGYPCGAASSTLIAVDEATGYLVTADSQALHVFNSSAHLIRTVGLLDSKGQPSSWFTWATLQNGSHMTVIFSSDVAHQNEATGAVTTGAIVFVPIS